MLEVLEVEISKELMEKIKEALESDRDVRWVIYDYINNSPYRGLILRFIRRNIAFLKFLKEEKHLIYKNYDKIVDYLIKIGESSGRGEG